MNVPCDAIPSEPKTIDIFNNVSLPLYVLQIGKHSCPSGHSFGPAYRPFFLIHLVVSGKGEIIRNEKSRTLRAGEAFLIYPDEITTYTADTEDPWTYYFINFGGVESAKYVKEATDKLFCPYNQRGLIELKSALENNVSDSLSALSVLFAVLQSLKLEKKDNGYDFVNTALNYIENNYHRPFNITELSEHLKVSRSHFSTEFRRRTGETPYNYLLRIRIAQAKNYLTSSSLSITEIAYAVGFASLERFSNLFIKYEKMSPVAYRKFSSKEK